MQDEPEHDVRRYRIDMLALLLVVAALFIKAPATVFGKRDEWHVLTSISGILFFLGILCYAVGQLLLPPDDSKTAPVQSKTTPD